MKIAFIGAGNLATRLSIAMQRAGLSVVQVCSHTLQHAEELAGKLGCTYTDSVSDVVTDADIYVFAVKDSALADLLNKLPLNKGLWVHTAGSVPMDVFASYTNRYGVFYPLQTFSKNRETDFSTIPVFVEANLPDDETLLKELAGKLTDKVVPLSSEKRKYLHLAAVWANNFTNHMYLMAAKILADQGVPADLLLPLIDETAAKVHSLSPREAQTGPAMRYDENVINKHIELLSDPDMKVLYRLISLNIHKESENE